MDFLLLQTRTKYKILNAHLLRLLSKTQQSFGSNGDEYVLFLMYCLLPKDKKVIQYVDEAILIFLEKIERFWFDQENPEENILKEVKQCLAHFIIFNHLELFIIKKQLKNSSTLLRNIQIENGKCKEFLSDKKEEIDIVLQQFLEFVKPNESVESWIRKNIKPINKYLLSSLTSVNFIPLQIYFFSQLFSEIDGPEERGAAFLFVAVMSGITFYVTTRFMSFISPLTVTFMSYMASLESSANLKKMNSRIFIQACKKDKQLEPFIPEAKEIDSFWHKPSHFDKLPTKRPIFFRTLVNLEIERLKTEMNNDKFIYLIISLILCKKVPLLTGIEYTIPIDIFYDPQAWWTKSTDFWNLNTHTLLQNYYRIALIEIVNSSINMEPSCSADEKEFYIQNLDIWKNKFKNEIEKINNHSLAARGNPPFDFGHGFLVDFCSSIAWLILRVFFATFLLISYLQYFRAKKTNPEFQTEQQFPLGIFSFGLVLSLTVSGLVFSSLEKGFANCRRKMDEIKVKKFVEKMQPWSLSEKPITFNEHKISIEDMPNESSEPKKSM